MGCIVTLVSATGLYGGLHGNIIQWANVCAYASLLNNSACDTKIFREVEQTFDTSSTLEIVGVCASANLKSIASRRGMTIRTKKMNGGQAYGLPLLARDVDITRLLTIRNALI